MPRVNLTDAEAAHIEKLRAKNAADIAWNAAIARAKEIIKDLNDPGDIKLAEARLDLELRKIVLQ